MKKIDLSKTVYELVKKYPELKEVLKELGFSEITKAMVLNTMGRMTTIPQGARLKGIPMETILTAFRNKGFEVEPTRTERLKSYLQRLNDGESLDSVREDFVAHFDNVASEEIMKAEQEMIAEGMPVGEVQHLCDVHSALFHGKTDGEQAPASQEDDTLNKKITKAVHEVASTDFRQKHDEWVSTAQDNTGRAEEMRSTDGHPLQTLYAENDALINLLEGEMPLREKVEAARSIAIHYAKKGDLLYPVLNVSYGIFGPSQVMWTVDDEIRDEMTRLVNKYDGSEEWNARAKAVLQRAAEMVYKENNILFPLCAANFTDEEWQQIYRDSRDYAPCLGVEPKTWKKAEEMPAAVQKLSGDEVRMPGGHLTIPQLTAMLNTLPFEITFVDADNINRYFNEGHKVFKRPSMAIDREVFTCHPPKVEPMVRAIINDFRSGKRDQVPVWMEKLGHPMYVNYMAVRDADGRYLGTVEIAQDMEFARRHFVK